MKRIFDMLFGIEYEYYVVFSYGCNFCDLPLDEKNALNLPDNTVPSEYDNKSVIFVRAGFFSMRSKIQNEDDIDILTFIIADHVRARVMVIRNFILVRKKFFRFKRLKELKILESMVRVKND